MVAADNSFVDQGITYIKAAVAADEKGDFDNALTLFQDGVGRVALAIKYEKNESRRKLLMERCDGGIAEGSCYYAGQVSSVVYGREATF